MTETKSGIKHETRMDFASGASKGDKIFRFDQIPARALKEVAARFGTGSLKYPQVEGLDNWRHGYPWSISLAALERHLNAFKAGEDNDAEQYLAILDDGEDPLYDEDGELRPGVTHLSAVVWHALALLEWSYTHPEFDDRPTTVLARNAAGVASTEDDGAVDFDWNPVMGEPAEQDARKKRQDRTYANRYHEGGKVYDILPMYTTVRVDLEDGRKIHGTITAIREVDNGDLLRYDVTYGGGLCRLGFVPPSQVTAE